MTALLFLVAASVLGLGVSAAIGVGVQSVLRWVAVGTFLTLTFNSIRVAGVPIADLFLVSSLGVLGVLRAASGYFRRPTNGALATFTILVLAASTLSAFGSESFLASYAEAAELLLATVGLIILAQATQELGVDLSTIALWILLGCGISAAIALFEQAGGSAVVQLLTPDTGFQFTGRSQGLTIHPNQLGLASAIAIPLGTHIWAETSGIRRAFVTLAIVCCFGGVLVSGSRAGLLALCITIAAYALKWISPEYEFELSRLVKRVKVGLLGIGATLLMAPLIVASAGRTLSRLAGDETTQIANADRAEQLTTSLAKIVESPIVGSGFSDSAAHSFPIQVLQTTGLVGAFAFVALLYGAWRRIRFAPSSPLVTGIALSLFAWLTAVMFHNGFTQRYFYVPLVLALSLPVAIDRRESIDEELDFKTGAIPL